MGDVAKDAAALVRAKGGSSLVAEEIHFAVEDRGILNGIDLSVKAGEKVAVIGPNGSGKSTFLRCLYAWHRPTSGAVLLDGRALADISASERARHLAVLAQQSETGLGLSIAEVVALGRLPHRRLWAGESSQDVIAVDEAIALMGLQHLASRSVATLSGGEMQRVLFARALAQRPQLLILDEPTNHLDIRHQLELLNVASGLGVTVIATLHDINIASRWCDRICLIDQGRVRALGAPEAVLDPDLIASVYSVTVDRDRDPRTGHPRFTFHIGN